MLSFDDDIGDAHKKACYHDSDNDAIDMSSKSSKERNIQTNLFVQRDISEETLQNALPQSLLALVNVILEGLNIKHQTQLVTTANTKASHSISQFLVFNSVKHTRDVDSFYFSS